MYHSKRSNNSIKHLVSTSTHQTLNGNMNYSILYLKSIFFHRKIKASKKFHHPTEKTKQNDRPMIHTFQMILNHDQKIKGCSNLSNQKTKNTKSFFNKMSFLKTSTIMIFIQITTFTRADNNLIFLPNQNNHLIISH